MVMSTPTEADVWHWLDAVMDPEVPVVSVVDLGIVRQVRLQDEQVDVVVTPTYSGCPATEVIAHDITQALQLRGLKAHIHTQIAPPWSSDWMSAKGREALRAYGIAPPAHLSNDMPATHSSPTQVVHLQRPMAAVACPLCGSAQTRLISQFGSTACKALYRCNSCLEPFDYFKPH
jgi:ring-1,2-phenylacetyl-CoA epoxidase subunit PaaD